MIAQGPVPKGLTTAPGKGPGGNRCNDLQRRNKKSLNIEVPERNCQGPTSIDDVPDP